MKDSAFIRFGAAAGCALLGVALAVSAVSAAERGAVAQKAMTEAIERLPAVTDVRIGGSETQTRFIMDLSAKIDVAAFALANHIAWCWTCLRSPSSCRTKPASRAAVWSRHSATV